MYSMRLVVYSMRLVAIMSTMGLVGYEPHSVSNDTTTERLRMYSMYSMRLVAIMSTEY